MKVLLLTPFSPMLHHDHAANDIALPLVKSLSKLVELHVYAPGQLATSLEPRLIDGVTYHPASAVKTKTADRLTLFPFGYRGAWPVDATREVKDLINLIDPDVVHSEYVQSTEPMMDIMFSNWSVTLHDVPMSVQSQYLSQSAFWKLPVQLLEYLKVRRHQRRLLKRAARILTFSERDKAHLGGGPPIDVVRVGVDLPVLSWTGVGNKRGLFLGALWREENVASARYLATEVWPFVVSRYPGAILRIVGARPTVEVIALGRAAGVEVSSDLSECEVSSEISNCGVALAPSMFEAGVLLKALRSLATASPVVLNSHSARPIGVIDGQHALVRDDAESFAGAVCDLFDDDRFAVELGMRGAELLKRNFTWDACARAYLSSFQAMLENSLGCGR